MEGLLLKLKLQYFGHLMQRADSLEKTVMLGKTEGRRSKQQDMRWCSPASPSMDEFVQTQEIMKDRKAWHAIVHGVTKRGT